MIWESFHSIRVLHTFPGMLRKTGFHQRIHWVICCQIFFFGSENGHKSTKTFFPCQRRNVLCDSSLNNDSSLCFQFDNFVLSTDHSTSDTESDPGREEEEGEGGGEGWLPTSGYTASFASGTPQPVPGCEGALSLGMGGSCRVWKVWTVMEFYRGLFFQALKRSGKSVCSHYCLQKLCTFTKALV